MTKNHQLKQIAKRIKKARVTAGYSQKDLGKALRLSDKTISAYEQGRALPPLDTMHKISRLTNQPLDYFMGEHKEKNSALQLQIKRIELELLNIKQALIENDLWSAKK